MEDDQKQKHICKFCNKTFPCGRSLGGHMRSHLINISPSDHHDQKAGKKLPRKKLPPLITDHSMENQNKTFLLQEKLCKQCGKGFQSRKALFGHMKCHRAVEDDSLDLSSSENQKLIMDSQSDNETATPLYRRKRSDRAPKRYTNSNSLNWQNISSPCVSEIDEQEQEEVALSLIMLSMDTGNSVGVSNNNSSEFIIETNKNKNLEAINGGSEFLKFKKIRNGKLEPTVLHSEKLPKREKEFRAPVKNPRFKLGVSFDEVETNLDAEEVNSPKYLIKKSQFEDRNKKSNKRKSTDSELEYKLSLASDQSEICQDFEKGTKFTCAICKKAFSSYQALGGHRASHKKFKGSCAPNSQNDTENSLNENKSEDLLGVFKLKVELEVGMKKKNNKEHECPICYRVFPSGQALGGHKRSHLITDQAKSSIRTNPSVEAPKQIPQIHNFLDLNLPAPIEDECPKFDPLWIVNSQSSSTNHCSTLFPTVQDSVFSMEEKESVHIHSFFL